MKSYDWLPISSQVSLQYSFRFTNIICSSENSAYIVSILVLMWISSRSVGKFNLTCPEAETYVLHSETNQLFIHESHFPQWSLYTLHFNLYTVLLFKSQYSVMISEKYWIAIYDTPNKLCVVHFPLQRAPLSSKENITCLLFMINARYFPLVKQRKPKFR